jgi:hypothetical protein
MRAAQALKHLRSQKTLPWYSGRFSSARYALVNTRNLHKPAGRTEPLRALPLPAGTLVKRLLLLNADADAHFLRYLVYALSGDAKFLGDMTQYAARCDPRRVPFEQNGADGA